VVDIYALREKFAEGREKKQGTKSDHLDATSGLADFGNKEKSTNKQEEETTTKRHIRA